jgi:hypothetical protein
VPLRHHSQMAEGDQRLSYDLVFDLAMFTDDHIRDAMESAGLEVFQVPEGLMGRGFYLGRVVR